MNELLRPITSEEIAFYRENGFVHLKQIISPNAIKLLRESLETAFERADRNRGARTDMTKAANALEKEGKHVLKDGDSNGDSSTSISNGRYLTEIECGRWNKGLRKFEHEGPLPEICGTLLGVKQIRFWGDHCFLKEAGSRLRTAFHQDAPYFPFTGNDACVCWVPVDSVSKESGAMGYVKGSHTWPEYSPNALVTNDRTHNDDTPTLPNIEENENKYKITYFDAEPGDVIIHYPKTCHGSKGNISLKRRLAASIRYVGDDVRWTNKTSEQGSRSSIGKLWKIERDTTTLGFDSRSLFYSKMLATYYLRKTARYFLPAGGVSMFADYDYENAGQWTYLEMQTGERLDERDCSRCAYPLVWSKETGPIFPRYHENNNIHRQIVQKVHSKM